MPVLVGFLINALISVALSLVSSLIQSALTPKAKPAGVRGSVTTGGDEPLSIIVGRYATAGHFEYHGTWGEVDGTPNAYYTRVVSLSDLPCAALNAVYVNGEICALGTPATSFGFPVLKYRDDDNVDHLWVKFYDGTQTTADGFLVSKFGADPDRPYLSDMIGRGVAYGIFTALVNRELFPGVPDVLWEVDGVSLFDRRTGTTIWSENPIVAVEGILRGIYYGSQWMYGLQTLPAGRLPSSNSSQMNKCDALMTIAAGGTEKKYRIGAEIKVDQEPASVIEDLLISCNGRIAEIGGSYKVLVDNPAAATFSANDETYVITESQELDPFPGLEDTYNGITATYPEPSEAWENKEAPPRYRSDLELLDDGRRLVANVNLPYVPFRRQVQRIMRTMIEEERRFRTTTGTLPPAFYEAEVLDGITLNSSRNGFVNKVMLITAMDDLPSCNQIVALKEIDPTDYDWTSGNELPTSVFPLVVVRPPSQLLSGWGVVPDYIPDASGTARRPSMRISCDGGLHDIRNIRVQVRVKATGVVVFDSDSTVYAPPYSWILNGVFTPNTLYQARGKFIPIGPRATEFSAWLDVLTPDVRLGTNDFYPIDTGGFATELKDRLAWVSRSIALVRDDLSGHVTSFSNSEFRTNDTFKQIRSELSVARGEDRVTYENLVTVAIDQNLGALASSIETLNIDVAATATDLAATASALNAVEITVAGHGSTLTAHGLSIDALEVSVGDVSAGGRFVTEVEATPGGGWARIGLHTFATIGGTMSTASFFLDAKTDGTSRAIMVADQFFVTNSLGTIAAMFAGDTVFINTLRIKDLTATNITAKSIDANDITIDGTLITNLFNDDSVNRVTFDEMASQYNFPDFSGPPTSENTIWTFSVTPKKTTVGGSIGKLHFVLVGIVGARNNDSGAYGSVRIRLKRAGSTVTSRTVYYDENGVDQFIDGPFSMLYSGTAASTASITFTVTAQILGGGGTFCSIRIVEVLELKSSA